MTELRRSGYRHMGDFTPTERQTSRALPPAPPVRPRGTPAPKTRLQALVGFAKREFEDAEEELGEREFAVYCAILIIALTAKHLPENE